MTSKENIVLTRKEQSKPRYTNITSRRGTFYRSPSEQLRDAQDLQACIDQARAERRQHENT